MNPFSGLSSYNIANSLIPGTLLSAALFYADIISVGPESILSFLIVSYFLGAIASRFGSLLLDPILQRSGFIVDRNYSAYVKACKEDAGVRSLVETANSYRTLAAIGLLFLATAFLDKALDRLEVAPTARFWSLAVLTTILFIFAYLKQYKYVSARVSVDKSET